MNERLPKPLRFARAGSAHIHPEVLRRLERNYGVCQSPATFELAAASGFSVLTNMNFSSIGKLEEVAGNYRRKGSGDFTVMMHPCILRSSEDIEVASEALSRYLAENLEIRNTSAEAKRGSQYAVSGAARKKIVATGVTRIMASTGLM